MAWQPFAEMEHGKLERAYRTFVRCRHVTTTAADEASLLRDVCVTAVRELGFTLAWVGLVSQDDDLVHPIAQAGYEAGYLESIAITWSDDERGRGPTGRAVRERRPCISRDIAHDPKFAPWREDALRRGYASSAAIPLLDGARCLGTLNLYAGEPDAFDDDEIALLEEMAVDVVLGIVRLRTTSELREMATRVERAAHAEAANAAAAGLVHDVNNLLQVVALAIESARLGPDAVERDEALSDAECAASTAMVMMRRLTSVHRRALESAEEADVDLVLQGIEPLLARLAPRAEIRASPHARGARARITPLDLERILINLTVNAGHAMPNGGTVTISTELCDVGSEGASTSTGRLAPGRYLLVVFEDTGPGIGADVLPRIFDPFFTTKGEAGTGLGLPSVLHIARIAGGSVSAESPPGSGARFSVYLPTVGARLTP